MSARPPARPSPAPRSPGAPGAQRPPGAAPGGAGPGAPGRTRPPRPAAPPPAPLPADPASAVLEVSPGPRPDRVRAADGTLLTPPEGWSLLPPGDAMLTRRVKAGGPHWVVQEKAGRKLFSKGVWAPTERIERCQRAVAREKATPAHARKLALDAQRRAREQVAYVAVFQNAIQGFLKFPPRYAEVATAMARAVAEHATPVGSGTVARTERIPVEQRAEAAVIAWMRHQTTAYDDLHIPRVKGLRREVRRDLAARSRALLERYRRGQPVDAATCPLARALAAGPRPDAGRDDLDDLDDLADDLAADRAAEGRPA